MTDPKNPADDATHELSNEPPNEAAPADDTDPRDAAVRELGTILDDIRWLLGEATEASGRMGRSDDAASERTWRAVNLVAERAAHLTEACERFDEARQELPPERGDD